MTIQSRRERERAEREKLIVTAARELVETEGWDAVTTRRLAERVEYSQPVLYSHFRGKDAIMAAVAVEGFAELAAELAAARASAEPVAALAAVSRAYTAFAERRPALYDAMFTDDASLHGLRAVAELKPHVPTARATDSSSSPRPQGRGRIEASPDDIHRWP